MSRKKVNIAIPKLKQHSDKVLADLNYNCTVMNSYKNIKTSFRKSMRDMNEATIEL